MPEEFDIQKLLRLKRYEQPPPEYFEGFLREFHTRQREELLRQPLWRIAFERFHAFIGELALPRLAYAGATAAVLISAGLASYNIINGPAEPARIASAVGSTELAHQVAANASEATLQAANQAATPTPASNQARTASLAWNSQGFQLLQPEMPAAQIHGMNASATTRYVIDSHPVSYESPSSF